jgi:N-acetylornithine carbamoyltransferase
MAAMRGMEVTVLRPEGFGLPEPVVRRAGRAAERSGGSVRETDDRDEALEGAHVLYAKSWTSPLHYGEATAEAALRSRHRGWCVGEDWFRPAHPSAKFLHCLPVRRGVVVRDEVLDGARSVVVRQAANRMYAQMAVLYRMLAPSGKENGS